jgi:tRNA-specific 2-thiouridylase
MDALRHVVFPLGEYMKSSVRDMAREAGLAPAEKRSSAGICFIGRRNFANFLSEYVQPQPGRYVDAASGKDVGRCDDVLKLTHGQRAGIGGKLERTYVVGKDIARNVVYVATGRGNSALLTKSACLGPPHWLSDMHENMLRRDGYLRCEFSARYREKSRPCMLHLVCTPAQAAAFEASSFCSMQATDAAVFPGCVLAIFDEPASAITPGQMFVMYDGDVCLGSAPIVAPGKTVFELENSEVEML